MTWRKHHNKRSKADRRRFKLAPPDLETFNWRELEQFLRKYKGVGVPYEFLKCKIVDKFGIENVDLRNPDPGHNWKKWGEFFEIMEQVGLVERSKNVLSVRDLVTVN